jgi:hypothetical protein
MKNPQTRLGIKKICEFYCNVDVVNRHSSSIPRVGKVDVCWSAVWGGCELGGCVGWVYGAMGMWGGLGAGWVCGMHVG